MPLALTALQPVRTSQWLQGCAWQAWLGLGRGSWAQRWAGTVVLRLAKLWRHRTWRCCVPGPHDRLQADHSPTAQLGGSRGSVPGWGPLTSPLRVWQG